MNEDLRDGSIDAGLFVLLMVTPRGREFTQQEIADVCGCSKGYIWLLEKQARCKLRKAFEHELPQLQRDHLSDRTL